MTAAELKAFINFERDEYGSVDLTDDEMSHFINKALFDFRTRELPKYEKNEWTRRALLPLRVEVTPAPSLTINTSAYTDFTVCTELAGEFPYSCSGGSRWFPITPVTDDTQYDLGNDPLGSPTEFLLYPEPKYKTVNDSGVNKIKILSPDIPTALNMAYLRQFNEVNLSTSPNAVVDYDPLLTHEAIGILALINILSTYQDPRFSLKIYEDRYASLIH